MDPRLNDFLTRLADADYVALTGGDLRLRLPLREEVINDLLATTVVAAQPKIDALDVRIQEGNQLRLNIASPAIPIISRLTVEFVVDRAIELSPSPTLRLFLVERGPTRWLSFALPFFASQLPPSVTRDGTTLIIDIRALLVEHGWDAIIPFTRSATFESERGVLWIDLHLAR
jgi:hypothetical protein